VEKSRQDNKVLGHDAAVQVSADHRFHPAHQRCTIRDLCVKRSHARRRRDEKSAAGILESQWQHPVQESQHWPYTGMNEFESAITLCQGVAVGDQDVNSIEAEPHFFCP